MWRLALAGILLLATLAVGADAAIISNGVVQLGVTDEGALNVPGGTPSAKLGTTSVGLRDVATNLEATAHGCWCEGWGVSYDKAVTGSCNGLLGCPAGSLVLKSFTATSYDAKSVVRIGDLEVTHHYAPSPMSAMLYEVNVTIENLGAAHSDIRYRRTFDWDVEPTAFNEVVTLDGVLPAPAELVYSSNNGFIPSDPLGGTSASMKCATLEGYPTGVYREDIPPCDQGSAFEFAFGGLGPGGKRSFSIFYGAAPDEAAALKALMGAGAEVWSLGQCDPAAAACDVKGGPVTFMFGFGGISPRLVAHPVPELPTCGGLPTRLHDLSITPPKSSLTKSRWSFGDKSSVTIDPWTSSVLHTYAPGTYNVTLNVTNDQHKQDEQTRVVKIPSCRPDAIVAPGSVAFCVHEPITFLDHSTTPAPSKLVRSTWDFGDGDTKSGPWTPSVTHTYTVTGIYKVLLEVENDAGEKDDLSFKLSISLCHPEVDYHVPTVCRGAPTSFIDLSYPYPSRKLTTSTWDWGDGTSTHGAWTKTVVHTYDEAGTYLVGLVVKDDHGNSGTRSKSVDVVVCLPEGDFDWSRPVCHNHPTAFVSYVKAGVSGAAVVAADWDFGDATASGMSPSYTFLSPGPRTVSVVFTDANGQSVKASRVVEPQNGPPVLEPAGPFAVEAGTVLTFALQGSDPNGDPTVLTMAGPQGALLLGDTFTWKTPPVAGHHEAHFALVDPYGLSATQTVLIETLQAEAGQPTSADADGDGAPDAMDDCPAGCAVAAVPEPAAAVPTTAPVTHAVRSDIDHDGVPDGMDNCLTDPNPVQHDKDRDGLGDACDPVCDHCPDVVTPSSPSPSPVPPSSPASAPSGAGLQTAWLQVAAVVSAAALGVGFLLVAWRKTKDQ